MGLPRGDVQGGEVGVVPVQYLGVSSLTGVLCRLHNTVVKGGRSFVAKVDRWKKHYI